VVPRNSINLLYEKRRVGDNPRIIEKAVVFLWVKSVLLAIPTPQLAVNSPKSSLRLKDIAFEDVARVVDISGVPIISVDEASRDGVVEVEITPSDRSVALVVRRVLFLVVVGRAPGLDVRLDYRRPSLGKEKC